MKGYTLRMLLSALHADASSLANDLLEREIVGISTDSRTIRQGEVFFALRGKKYDGSQYVKTAFTNGALCAVINASSIKNNYRDMPIIPVTDTIRALGDTAFTYRSLFSGKVIAITGTSGKTTVKEMLRSVLAKRLRVHSTRGNLNNHIGLPLSVFGLEENHECAVFELGMSAPGEIAYLTGIAQPHIGVILNVGPAHMEFFPSLEAVAEAKLELLEKLGDGGTAVINGDDELLRRNMSPTLSRIVTFGINGPWDYVAGNVFIHPDGCASFDIKGFRVMLKVPGLHNVYNALAAYAVGMLMGVEAHEAVAALETFTAPEMRMQIVEKKGVRFINDSYNANPMSMESAAGVLKTMTPLEGGRKIAVLGDMLELGSLCEDAHFKIGRLFARSGITRLCLVGRYAVHYKCGAIAGGMNQEHIRNFPDPETAARFIDEIKCSGDIILVKGSRAVGMEKIISLIDGID